MSVRQSTAKLRQPLCRPSCATITLDSRVRVTSLRPDLDRFQFRFRRQHGQHLFDGKCFELAGAADARTTTTRNTAKTSSDAMTVGTSHQTSSVETRGKYSSSCDFIAINYVRFISLSCAELRNVSITKQFLRRHSTVYDTTTWFTRIDHFLAS